MRYPVALFLPGWSSLRQDVPVCGVRGCPCLLRLSGREHELRWVEWHAFTTLVELPQGARQTGDRVGVGAAVGRLRLSDQSVIWSAEDVAIEDGRLQLLHQLHAGLVEGTPRRAGRRLRDAGPEPTIEIARASSQDVGDVLDKRRPAHDLLVRGW